MVDIFSKYMVVIPIKSKSEGDVASGLIEGMNKMGKMPKILYTDNEGALNSSAIQKYLKDNDIQVVPGRAGGGSFKRKKNYIAKKEFAYRMCAR